MPKPKSRRRRPNLQPDELRSKQFVASVSRDEYEAYDAAADRRNLSLSAWARRALAAAIGAAVRPPPARVRQTNVPPTSIRSGLLVLRLRQDEWDAFHAEVKRQDTTRSEWVRRVLDRAAGRTPKK